MAPVPEPAFRDLLAEISREAFVDFLADLWAARGHDVAREGDRVIVDDRRVLVPVVDDGGVDPRDDRGPTDPERVLVSATTTDGDRGIGPAELRQILLYGIPRDRAAELFEGHFDRELDGEWPGWDRASSTVEARESPEPAPDARCDRHASPSDRGDPPAAGSAAATDARTDRSPGRRDGHRSRRMVVLGIVIALVVGLAAAAPVAPPAGEWLDGESTATDPTGTPTPESALHTDTARATAGPGTGSDADTTETTAVDYPPGVASDGVRDAGVLARAHLRGVANRSFELTVTYREYQDGAPTGTVREWIRVDEPTGYVSRVERTGMVLGEPRAVSEEETYANGALRYDRRVQAAEYVTTVRDVRLEADWSPFDDRVAGLVRTLLSTRDSRIVGTSRRDGVTNHLIVFRGEEGVGSVRVDEVGVVHSLHWRFTSPDEPHVTAELVVRYDFGPVTVSEPAWVEDARNATAD